MVKTVQSNWTNAVLICRKCSKKLDGGFGPEGGTALAKVLRRHVKDTAPDDGRKHKGRRAHFGVVEVGCLGVCPKRAVTTVLASRPGEWVLVPEQTSTPEVLQVLGLNRHSENVSAEDATPFVPSKPQVTPFPPISRRSQA